MLNNDLDEDFPLNGGSNKLDKLFEENSLPDISFKFAAPKAPVAKSKPLQNSIPLKVVFAKTVEAFQMKVTGYKSEGKVGIAIIGNDEHCFYQLYMYRSDEKKVTSVEVNYQFGFLVQQHNYASFKDSHNIQWSIHFDKPPDLIAFSREIALARWRSCHGSRQKLVQEAFKGSPDVVAKKTDVIRVSYNVYSLSPENILHEEEGLKKTEVGPVSNGPWEINMVGACLKSKRFVILPAHLSSLGDICHPEGYHLLLELEVKEVTPPPSVANDTIPQPAIHSTTPSQNSVVKEEVESLPDRIAKIGVALPSVSRSEPESSIRLISDKSTPNTSNASLHSMTSLSRHKEDFNSLLEPSDVSTTSQFNVLFSEVRTNNSEIRMNINRVTDKVDSLLSKMDVFPQINYDVIPTFKKVQDIESVLNKLVDQNKAMMLLLEKNSPEKFEYTFNELIQLKKRNIELESFMEVSRSTTQILKDKVGELTEKNSFLEKLKVGEKSVSTNYCVEGGDNNYSLEESVRSLKERNYSLFEAAEVLQKQNQLLTSELSQLQCKNSEKDLKIAELENEVRNLTIHLNNVNKEAERRKDIGTIIMEFKNSVYESVTERLRDSSSDPERFDKILSLILRELTRTYLTSEEIPPNTSKEIRKTKEDNQMQVSSGNFPFSPSNNTPLPAPKPRKPIVNKSQSPPEEKYIPPTVCKETLQTSPTDTESSTGDSSKSALGGLDSPSKSRNDPRSSSPYYYAPLFPSTPPPIDSGDESN